MRVCLLVPAPDYPERWDWAYDNQAEALRRVDLVVEPRPWTEPGDVSAFDLILPLVAWGYNLEFTRWMALLDQAEREQWRLVNPAPLLRWNSDKTYLAELGERGIPTVDTVAVDRLDDPDLAAARSRFATDELIVKPPISAGAHGTYRLGMNDVVPDDVAGTRMLVQPFERSIEGTGEWSLLLFDGVLSHAIIKRPKPGDFRVQPHLGGFDEPCEAPAGSFELARAALAAAPARATYARVDIIRSSDGDLKIMELELIEPALFLHHSADCGAAFASAVRDAAAQP